MPMPWSKLIVKDFMAGNVGVPVEHAPQPTTDVERDLTARISLGDPSLGDWWLGTSLVMLQEISHRIDSSWPVHWIPNYTIGSIPLARFVGICNAQMQHRFSTNVGWEIEDFRAVLRQGMGFHVCPKCASYWATRIENQ